MNETPQAETSFLEGKAIWSFRARRNDVEVLPGRRLRKREAFPTKQMPQISCCATKLDKKTRNLGKGLG